MKSRNLRPLVLAALLPLMPSCSRAKVTFRVTQGDPGPGSEVALNQELWITFSRFVDPASVTARTVRVLDGQGRSVPGLYRVQGKVVIFRPRPPLDRELESGGFRPGRRYRLEIPGFPRMATVRSRGPAGASLAETFRLDFRTRSAGDLLVDLESPRVGAWPRFEARMADFPGLPVVRVPAGTNPRIPFSEPIDPRSLTSCGPFELATLAGENPVPLDDVRLARKGVAPAELGRVIELVPSRPLEPGKDYRLQIRGGPWLEDYGGRGWASAHMGDEEPLNVLVRVEPRLGEEFFGDSADCDPATAPGEAWGWWGEGELSVALLEEAGEGELGPFLASRDLHLAPGAEIDLGGRSWICPRDGDLSFSRLIIPREVTVTLAAGVPWVLRSQGPLEIRGRLRVAGRGEGGGPPPGTGYLTPARLLAERRARLAAGGVVLLASANLSLAGAIDAPGRGVLLASGGQVLLAERARVEAAWLEVADRRSRKVLPDPGCPLLATVLAPPRPGRGWVGEPLPVAARSTFRPLPPGTGRLAQPLVDAAHAPDLEVALQGAPADPRHPGRPDLSRLTP